MPGFTGLDVPARDLPLMADHLVPCRPCRCPGAAEAGSAWQGGWPWLG